MEPITVAAIVGYLAKSLKENKAFKDFTSDFTEASINWIRPIFLKTDNSPKDVLKELKEKPESISRKKAAEAAIESKLEEDPNGMRFLKEIYTIIKGKESQQQATVINSKNVNTGSISAGGNVSIGDGGN